LGIDALEIDPTVTGGTLALEGADLAQVDGRSLANEG
jgi:hypothetical protein